ncbi:MAG: ABC transporter permease [Clostridiales bacterium]|nr:ABC transporter permease [Clostridiales bacterium]
MELCIKRKKKTKKAKENTPGREAWRRLKRNRLAIAGLIILIILVLVAVFANFIAPEGIDDQKLEMRLKTPGGNHLMGTDKYGRDIFSRVVYGTRVSIPISFACVIIAFAIGGALGSIAAFYGGKVDNVIMRFMDIFQSIPPMLMAIAIAASLGSGVINLILAISISTAPARSRVVRAAIMTVKSNDYIESATAVGSSKKRLLLKYMLPNALGPVLTNFTFSIATALLTVSALSFIGLGIQAPIPEWGAMLADGREYLQQYPHVLIFPGLMIMITVLSLNMLGDGVRDALDPRLK